MNGISILTDIAIPVSSVLGAVIAVLSFHRGRRATKLSNELVAIQLWEANSRALAERVEQLEAQNAAQAEQIRTQGDQIVSLHTENARLVELITHAAAVSELAAQVGRNHAELVAKLDSLRAT